MPPRKYGAILPNTLTGWALRQFCMVIPNAPEYREAFWGQVWELAKPEFWEKDGPDDERDEIAARVWLDVLNDPYNEYLAGGLCEQTDYCKLYPNTAPFISYYPNDPRYTPDFIPPHYAAPPWYKPSLAEQLVLGAKEGDIVTSLDRFLVLELPTWPPEPGYGLPQFTVRTIGVGVVKLHFRNVIFGGKAQVTIDDNALGVFYVDVNRDQIAIPFETLDEITVNVNIDTPGEHKIDVIMVPNINDEIPFFMFGGGLVAVELCGLQPYTEVPPVILSGYPIGAVIPYYAQTAPDTTLDCDGSQHLRVDYPELYDVLAAQDTSLIIDADNFVTPVFPPEIVIQPSTFETELAALYDGQAGGFYHYAVSELAINEDGTGGVPGVGDRVGWVSDLVGSVPAVASSAATRGTLAADSIGLPSTNEAAFHMDAYASLMTYQQDVTLMLYGVDNGMAAFHSLFLGFYNVGGDQRFKGLAQDGSNWMQHIYHVGGYNNFDLAAKLDTLKAVCISWNAATDTVSAWADDTLVLDAHSFEDSWVINPNQLQLGGFPFGGFFDLFTSMNVIAWGIIDKAVSQAEWLAFLPSLQSASGGTTIELPRCIVASVPIWELV